MEHGYVYVLVHPSHSRFVAVGSATSDPNAPERAADLSPFLVVFARKVPALALDAVLKEILRILTENGYAADGNPNYFSCTATSAITVLLAVCDVADSRLAELSGNTASDDQAAGDFQSSQEARALYDAACDAVNGSGDALEDHREAMRLFTRAAELGEVRAYDDLGELFYTSDTVKNERRAIETWNEGAKLGSPGCWANLGFHYDTCQHTGNAKKCWDRFFSLVSALDPGNAGDVTTPMAKLLTQRSDDFFLPLYRSAFKRHQVQISDFMDAFISVCEARDFPSGVVDYRRGKALLEALTKSV